MPSIIKVLLYFLIDNEVLKLLVDRENERRSMAMINEEQERNISEESVICVDTPIADEAKKESFIWPDEAVLLFLEIYRNKEPTFALGLKRHNKIWLEIAEEMKTSNYNVTAVQCQNKMSGLKRTYKNISDSNKKSGNHSSSWAFYSAMDSIFGKKAWVAPVSIASSDGPVSPSTSSSTISEISIDEPKPKKRRVESILESFIMEIKTDKEKERQEREQRRAEKKIEKEERQKQITQEQWKMHQDKMKLQQSLIDVLNKVVQRKKEEVTEEI
ncbi:hypothetical protein ALC62_03051 [Cyphomyrmex costatus]|uniref:Myb/SANT-like DNA-binding domain-containing protein n=1 Tax=Cyphomyrmex costatus TaxID=456900 RepID=A0A151IMA3_9HYME|nr:hypothetical protein ALC62_03051 [Cyphomyrmex costatus]